MKKLNIIGIAIIIIVIGLATGGFLIYQSNNNKNENIPVTTNKCPTTNEGKTITYKGVAGSTALALLNNICEVGTDTYGMVATINGLSSNSAKNEFWSFSINGATANEGAGTFITKDSDTITWVLTSY